MKKIMVIAAMFAAFGLGTAAAFASSADKPPAPPGQGACDHGNSPQECKDDPSEHGKDCEAHGNHGGVNEDHCKGEETETTETETTETETTETETTQTETTQTETTPTTPTETTPTTPETTTTVTTTTTETTVSTPTETTVTEVEPQVFTPPVKPKVKSGSSGPAAVADPAEPVSVTKPSKAAQPAPFTP
jgi:hypothetical protein